MKITQKHPKMTLKMMYYSKISNIVCFDDVLEGLLYLALEIEDCRERVGEHVEHGVLDRVMDIFRLRTDNKTIRRNCI